MRIHRTILVFAALSTAAALASAQPAQAPKPGPEAKKLDAFVGKWKGEGTMSPGPWGPGGKMTSEDDCSWFEGGFQLICRGTGEGPMGKVKSEMAMAWNGEEKIYKWVGFDSTGMMGTSNGTVSGNTWTWMGEDKMGGKMIKSKYTIVMTSPTAYTFKWETSEDGKTWKTAAEGTSTKK